ncbi:leucine-rich repeat domain-containing protein [Prevotellamassilia timonensis]|uniref:leucine-rich repeat domain-containing protein n=1 Tax=Prevotellamassilia timonensis TaxID=1852370 RepID=UPI0023F4A033|nr:leucine-rich repeat domain-containing protein [Prevotellamassilia timonensis]MDD7439628.1 leucine-rich repeat domain-containing protein [Prevotellamassilia timonensis]
MKFLHKLLVFALLFVGVITQASAEAFTVNGVVYRITDTGVAVNNLAKDNNLNGIVYVPEEVQYGSTTYKVTGIDYFGNKDIREISLPGTIKNIADWTFQNCNNLQTVKLGEGISYVSDRMFNNCTALKHVSLPNSLQNIGSLAFGACTSLKSLQLPKALESLGNSAFSGCESLSNIELPESLQTIGILCFNGCDNLSTIKVSPANPYFSTDGKAIFNKDKTVLYTAIPVTSYNIPSTVRELRYYAFSDQKDMTSITLPEGLVSISSYAFSGCSKLEHLVIPSTVDSISNYAFYGCSALQQINIPQSIKSLADGVLSYSGIKTLDIPSSVNYIGESAFSNCKSLQSIKLPERLTLLNYNLFDGCERLSDIQIPSTVTAIEDCAFNGCKALQTITLPASLCTFENTSWSDNSIFSGCSALKSILVEAGNKYYESDGTALYNKAKDTLVCFPAGVTSYVVPQSVKTIARKAFCGCDSLQNIMFEDGVSDLVIEQYAFENCKNINRLVITSGIKETKYGAFNDAHINKLVITTTHPRSFYEYYLLRDNTIETIYAPASDLSIIKNLKSSTLIPLDAIYVASDITIGSRSIVFKLVKNEELSGLDELPVNTYPCVKIGNKEIEADENGRYVHAGLAPDREFTYTISAKDSQGENVGSAYSFTKETASLFKSFTLNSGQTYVASSNIRLNVDPEMEQPDECRFVYGYSYTKSCDLKYSDEVQSIKFTGFWPSTTVTLNYQELKDGKVTYSKEYNIMTKDMGLSAEFGKITPTSYTMTGSRNKTYHDAEVVDEGWTLDRKTITQHGSTLHVTGCEPESYVNAGYAVMVKNGSETKLYYYSPNNSKQLPALTLETVAEAKATSNTVALICATTNIDDEEANTGFEWRRYDAPDLVPSSKANCPVVDGIMTGALRNLSASTYYKFRPFYKAESGKTWYGEWSAFGTADAYVYFDPTVRTYAVVCHDENSATVSGFIIAGSDDIKEQGFEYWKRDDAYATAKHATATTDDNTHQTVVATGQRMSAVLQNLEPNTTYIVRAYVTTEHGTTYGEEQIFSTPYSTAIGEVELDEAYSDHLAAKVTKVGDNELHLAICGTARPVAIRLTAVSGIQMAATTLGSSLESTRHACLHTNRLQPGMYLLHVTDGQDAQTIRIAIK